MSEIKLFEVCSSVKELTSSTVLLEKELQNTIENKMGAHKKVIHQNNTYGICQAGLGQRKNKRYLVFDRVSLIF